MILLCDRVALKIVTYYIKGRRLCTYCIPNMGMQAETSWKALLGPICCNFHKLTTIAIIASKAAIFHRTFITYKISSPNPYLLDYPPLFVSKGMLLLQLSFSLGQYVQFLTRYPT